MQALSLTTDKRNPNEAWWAGLSARDDRSALALLQTEQAGGRHQRTVYELFAEMEEKDGHLYAVLQTRLNGLLGLRRRIVPAPPADEAALAAAEHVERAFDRIPRFQEMLRALLDAIAKGFAVVELVWDYDSNGHLRIVDWISHPQEWFAFSDRGALRLLSPPFAGPESIQPDEMLQAAGRLLRQPMTSFPAPPHKFLVLRFGADIRNPYGRGLNQRAYWLYWFKKNTVKYWAIFNEKYGSPTALATYGPGTTEEERRRLAEILDALQTETGVVIPQTVELKLLDQQRSGGGQSYREFLDWCNDEISKVVLGATLTSGEGRRSGSLALGNIHQLVRQDYIDADARLLESVLNESLIRWIVELNLGTDAPVPRLHIETDSPEDLNARIAVDRALLSLGVTLPQSYFYEQYGRPAPTAAETPLQFDDANFYGYHLQYGILTINEVRERLNLDPVPWGEVQTRAERASDGVETPREDKGYRPV